MFPPCQALLPPSSTDLDVSPLVQIASLMGVGLLYQGTADRHMVEVLLREIGKVAWCARVYLLAQD